MKNLILVIICAIALLNCKEEKRLESNKPNILFIMMDDLGYGQIGIYNDTITTSDFNPYFVHLVDSLQGYSLDKSLEFSKKAAPTLSKLAQEAIVFNRAFTSSNICAPSRLGIATGINQNKFGVYTNKDCEESGLVKGTHLVKKLQESNYYTAHIGKWHIGKRNRRIYDSILKQHNVNSKTKYFNLKKLYPNVDSIVKTSGFIGSVVSEQNPLNNGFDYYYGYNHWACQFYNDHNIWENFKHVNKLHDYNTDVFTDKALNVMKTSINNKKPFYVQLHYHAVHDSLEPKAPEKYFRKFNSGSYNLDNFYAHVNGVDENVKKIVKFLKSKNQYNNTIIIFTSDNGAMAGGSYNKKKTGSPLPANTPFSGHKGNFYQGGFRVPMFISWPKGITKPIVSSKMVSTMDILPTAIDASGANLPDNLDGKSLLPILKNKSDAVIHDYLVWSGIHSYKWGYLINKSTKTHKNESIFAPPAWVVIKGDFLLRFTGTLEKNIYYDFMQGRAPVFELYNIKNDPAETQDLSEQYPDLIESMKAIYFKESASFLAPVDWKMSKWKELKRDV